VVLRKPWLWSGPSRVVYLVDGCAVVDRQGSEAGRAMPSATLARTLPSGVADADPVRRPEPIGRAAVTGREAPLLDADVRARLVAKGYRLTVAR